VDGVAALLIVLGLVVGYELVYKGHSIASLTSRLGGRFGAPTTQGTAGPAPSVVTA
jgi:hypothetical protein